MTKFKQVIGRGTRINEAYGKFERKIGKHGYDSLKKAVFEEVPKVLDLDFIKRYFDVEYETLTIVKPYLQTYILIHGQK